MSKRHHRSFAALLTLFALPAAGFAAPIGQGPVIDFCTPNLVTPNQTVTISHSSVAQSGTGNYTHRCGYVADFVTSIPTDVRWKATIQDIDGARVSREGCQASRISYAVYSRGSNGTWQSVGTGSQYGRWERQLDGRYGCSIAGEGLLDRAEHLRMRAVATHREPSYSYLAPQRVAVEFSVIPWTVPH